MKNLILLILQLQEKFLKYRLSKTINYKSLKNKKRLFAKGCNLDFNAGEIAKKEALEKKLYNILLENDLDKTKLLEYIKREGTNVSVLYKIEKFLRLLNIKEGYINEFKGLKALILSLILNKKICLRVNDLFLILNKEINTFTLIYHFYNWFMCKNNIFTMNSGNYELLEKYLYTQENINNLKLSEIIELKDLIKTEKYAINFVLKLCQEQETLKKAHEKLKNKQAISL